VVLAAPAAVVEAMEERAEELGVAVEVETPEGVPRLYVQAEPGLKPKSGGPERTPFRKAARSGFERLAERGATGSRARCLAEPGGAAREAGEPD